MDDVPNRQVVVAWIFIICIFIATGIVALLSFPKTLEVTSTQIRTERLLRAKLGALQGDIDSIREYIHLTAEDYGVDPVLAVELARIESGFNPTAKNPNSSATGTFQFINSTWEGYCIGDRKNAVHNTNCALKILQEPEGLNHWLNPETKSKLEELKLI